MESYVHFFTGFVEGGIADESSAVFEESSQLLDVIGVDPLGNEEGDRPKVD